DGRIEFLGRIDHQVKIRGFRIELGEIEAALAQHPAVQEAVVLAREREQDAAERRLVGYAVAQPGAEVDAGTLRGWLGERLPAYMVPGTVVWLETPPRTATGKVDRRALPAPEADELRADPERVAPRHPTEELLADIWTEVLDRAEVGVHDDFFALGGHSLLATRVVSRVRRHLHVELPLQVFFERSTVAALAEWIAVERGRGGPAAPPLVPVAREGRLPVSFAQQRLWFLDRLQPGSALYNIPLVFHLRGALDRVALTRALDEIVRRHQVLRTRFATVDGEPVQIIAPASRLPLPMVDLTAIADRERVAEGLSVGRREARRPFDLARGPVLRAALLRWAAHEHHLLLTVHHVAFDGWSVGVLLRDLEALYQGSSPPAPPVQYADFAHWQRQWLTGEVLAAQLAYWRAQLSGLGVLELPGDRPRPPVQSYRGAVELGRLPATGAVDELGRRHGGTLFMTLLAAFQVLLARYTGLRDLAVGAPVANRDRAELEGLVGLFVNTLVLPGDLGGDPAFDELLARVRATALAAYSHQDLPFEQLVEELRPQRDLSQNPLVQVLFIVQEAPAPSEEIGPGIEIRLETLATGTAKFDLTLALAPGEEALWCEAEYSTDLFDRTTIRRLIGHFRTLLETVAADPSRRLSELPLLSAAERHQLSAEWNDASLPRTAWTGERGRSIHQWFEAQVEVSPEAIAVVGEERLSYRELNLRANRLAHHLRSLGVGPEVPVGIALSRSPAMVVAILAVLKAGGAYLPLDPDHPRQRSQLMLADARARVVLTEEPLRPILPDCGARLVCLDGGGFAACPAENPPPLTNPDNPAYLIYTSGSTGRPKGVAIPHRTTVAMLEWSRQAFSATELAGVLGSTSICFDISVFELFAPLIRGGAVIMAANALELPTLPAASAVTLINTVPSALRELLRLADLPSSVRTVNLAGEALPRPLVDGAYRKSRAEQVLNLYGPSEDTTYSTFARVARERTDAPPIGRPLAGSRAQVLDPRLRAVPIGVPGELYLGGAGVARGYFDRPALTAERFLPDPWSARPGGRLYRTGDLVRSLPDGELVFLGRRDHQVKLRGYRIELGEVEAAMVAHPGVREAVVGLRGDAQLVAWFTAEGEAPAAAELRRHLLVTLPEYMVPARFAELDALPLGVTGKVDRLALPAPKPAAAPGEEYVAPRTPTEELLAGLWSELLERERVGANDHFFELGGHSLLATQLVSRVRDVLGVELPLPGVFQEPTLAALAAYTDRVRGGARRPVPPIEPLPPETPPPLSFAQQRLWFVDQFEPGGPMYNMPSAVRVSGRLDAAVLARTLNEIVRRHQALRASFANAGGQPVQVIAPALEIELPLVDLRALAPEAREAEARRLTTAEGRRSFDLSRGPLLRATLVRRAAGTPAGDEHLVLLTMHHIVSDAWSMGVLIRELAAIYPAVAAGETSPLGELAIQYADFAAWQRQWLVDEVLDEEIGYWRRQLAGVPRLELPTDRPRPAVQSFR
ncbi:MAG: amino acid adenylation domain-containing protein, partial [bacterium]|nr:amino acid adenylation domain-containing protein [bacterium]